MIGLHGQPGHWTVATASSRMMLRLADSDGGHWLWKRPLRGSNRASFHAGRIDPYCLFLVEVRPCKNLELKLPVKLILQLKGVTARCFTYALKGTAAGRYRTPLQRPR